MCSGCAYGYYVCIFVICMCDYLHLGCAFTSEVVCICVVNLYVVCMHLYVECVCKGCMLCTLCLPRSMKCMVCV